MRITKLADARRGEDFLLLGVQTNPGDFSNRMHWLASRWAPKKAKSYTILSFRHTNYHGHLAEKETGYGDFKAAYFTTLKEGSYPVKRDEDGK